MEWLAIYNLFSWYSYEHSLMMIIAIEEIFTVLLLAGCTSPALQNVYVLSFSYSLQTQPATVPAIDTNLTSIWYEWAQNNTPFQVRAGYYSMCASVSDGHEWACANDVDSLRRFIGNMSDPFDLIGSAYHFRSKLIFPGLPIVAATLNIVTFLGFYSLPVWHTELAIDGSELEVKAFPREGTLNMCVGFTSISAFLYLVSAIWQHAAASAAGSAVEYVVKNNVSTSVGAAGAAFIWLLFGLSFIVIEETLRAIFAILIINSRDEDAERRSEVDESRSA